MFQSARNHFVRPIWTRFASILSVRLETLFTSELLSRRKTSSRGGSLSIAYEPVSREFKHYEVAVLKTMRVNSEHFNHLLISHGPFTFHRQTLSVNLPKSGIRDFFDIVAKMKDAISYPSLDLENQFGSPHEFNEFARGFVFAYQRARGKPNRSKSVIESHARLARLSGRGDFIGHFPGIARQMTRAVDSLVRKSVATTPVPWLEGFLDLLISMSPFAGRVLVSLATRD